MNWRLVYLGERDPHEVSSYNEAFAKAMKEGLITNSFYILRWSKPTVHVGRGGSFSDIKHDFRVEYGITEIRGSPNAPKHMFLDKCQFFLVFIYRSIEEPSNKEEMTRFQNGIVNTLDILGIKATLKKGGNDILIDGKKVSGIALSKYGELRTVRITLICDFDFDIAENAIVSEKDLRKSIITLNSKLGREITSEEMINALKTGFEPILEAEFGDVEYDLTDVEKSIVSGLREKYTSEEWIKRGKWSPVKDYWRPK